jgi:serine protease Do
MNWAVLLGALALAAAPVSADIYMYRDDRGILHFDTKPHANWSKWKPHPTGTPPAHSLPRRVPPVKAHEPTAQGGQKFPSWGGGLNGPPGRFPSGEPLEPADVFRRSAGSVYEIVATKSAQLIRSSEGNSLGSAVAVSDHTLITNCHIVVGAQHILLKQASDKFEATLSKADPDSDRCVLEVRGTTVVPISGIRPYTDLTVGERVYTIGTPQGLERTLGEGLVSGLRELGGVKLVQTTAPISPGSSGGGLFDSTGNLIGITTFLVVDAQALNFAIAAEEYWR